MTKEQIPRISVIVPAFNAELWLETCLRGIEQQDFEPQQYEIIVVDNNSLDKTPEIAGRHKGVTLLREPQQSSYAARNRGASAARAPVLAFTDADCAPSPNWLRTIDEAMRDSETEVVIGRREFGRGGLALRLIAEYESSRDRQVFSSQNLDTYYGYAGNMAVRAAVFQLCGPFPSVPRGGDSLFVQKVVSRNGCGGVIWHENMRVRLLEVRSFRAYAGKMFVYASARRQANGFSAPRSLALIDRMTAYRAAAARYPVKERYCLGGLLMAGYMAWFLGRCYNKTLAAMNLV